MATPFIFSPLDSSIRRYKLRTMSGLVRHVKIECAIARKEWKILLSALLIQYIHIVFHNVAYYTQANVLRVEQRFLLHDVGFALMPELIGTARDTSEYFVFGAVFAPTALLILSIFVFEQSSLRPRYAIIVLKRILLQLNIALMLRTTLFTMTALPGPARHCRLNFDPTCKAQNAMDPVKCVVPNPEFDPPTTSEIFTRLNALRGCGDLMFSSHTTYTLTFILAITKYWWHPALCVFAVCIQTVIALLIIAARKHYSSDVLTALYLVPMIWFLLESYMHDINHKDTDVSPETLKYFYNIKLDSSCEDRFDSTDDSSKSDIINAEEGRIGDLDTTSVNP